MDQPCPQAAGRPGPGRAAGSRAGAARYPLRLTPGRPGCPDRGEGRPGRGLAIARPTVYNVGMGVRAMQEATFLILDRAGRRQPARVRDHHRRAGDLRRPGPAATGGAVHRPGPAARGRADRGGPGRGRGRAAAPVLPAHAAGTGRLADEAARLQAHAGAAPTAGSPLRSSRLRVLLAAAACYGAAAGILNLAYCPGTVTSGTSGPASRPRPSGPRSRAAI